MKNEELLFLEPKAKEAIDHAVKLKEKGEKAVILMMVDGFVTNPEALHLRDMLWYARNNGVTIEMVPHEDSLTKTNK